MKKQKKPQGPVIQIISLTLLVIIVASVFTLQAILHLMSRAGTIWFAFMFLNLFLGALEEFNYIKNPVAKKRLKIALKTIAILLVLAPVSLMLPLGSGWKPYTFESERTAIEAERAIPDDQNAALQYQPLFENLGHNPKLPEYVKDNEDVLLRGPWKPKAFPEVVGWLQTQGDMIENLMQISEIPECRFPISTTFWDYQNRYAQLKFASQLLFLSANTDITHGNIQTGLKKYFAVIKIAQHSVQQLSFIDLQIGLRVEGRAIAPICNLIVEGNMNKEELSFIAQNIETKSGWGKAWPKILEGEKLQIKNTFGSLYEVNPRGRIRFTHSLSKSLPKEEGSEFETKAKDIVAPTVFALFAPRHPQTIGKIIDDMYTPLEQEDFDYNDLSSFEDHRMKTFRKLPGIRILLAMEIDSEMISKFYNLYLHQVAMRRGTHVLIGLKQYHMSHEKWPESLNEISSTVPVEALIDSTNDGKFIYTLTDDGFKLYSKGKNAIDENGEKDKETGADDILIWPLENK